LKTPIFLTETTKPWLICQETNFCHDISILTVAPCLWIALKTRTPSQSVALTRGWAARKPIALPARAVTKKEEENKEVLRTA
jgi:hypothetical protein